MERSSLEIFQEQQKREHEAALARAKRLPTQQEIEQSQKRFRSIQASNTLARMMEENDAVNTCIRDIEQVIEDSLREVSSAEEHYEVIRRAKPRLREFALHSDLFKISEWVHVQLQAIRADKNVVR